MKTKNAFLLSFAVLTLTACGSAAPDAGQEAVLIRKPIFFGHGGIVPEPIKTGRSFTAITTSAVYINVQQQTFDVAFPDMMSSDGIPLDFHGGLTLRVTDSVELVRNFSGAMGDDVWYNVNIKPVVNNYLRDAFKGHTMHALAIEASGTAAVEAYVRQKLEAYIAAKRIPVAVVNFALGRVNPPEAIKRQRVRTAEEQQRQETERQTKIAEENRKAAEQARAEADNAYRQSMSLSPEQFVELERIKMLNHVCDIQKDCTFIIGNGTALVQR